MKRHLSTIVASALAVSAITLLGTGLAASAAWRSSTPLVTKNYSVSGSFSNISITEYYADVELRVSRDGSVSVTTRDTQDVTHTVQVANGTLSISRPEPSLGQRIFHDDDDDPTVIVYLPAGDYGALTVNTASGDVESSGQLNFASASLTTTSGDIEIAGSVTQSLVCNSTSGDVDISSPAAGAVQINTTSGDIELTGASIQSLSALTVSGDTDLERTVASGAIEVSSTSGDIELERSDAASLTLTTTSGDVKGSLLTGKTFSASSTSGRVSVPASTPGAGACNVSTTSGSIRLTVRS